MSQTNQTFLEKLTKAVADIHHARKQLERSHQHLIELVHAEQFGTVKSEKNPMLQLISGNKKAD